MSASCSLPCFCNAVLNRSNGLSISVCARFSATRTCAGLASRSVVMLPSICIEGLGKLIRTLLQLIALLQELRELTGLLVHETLDFRQSRIGDLTGLIRTPRQHSCIGHRVKEDIPLLIE